jgi:hypothetical protein
MTKEIFREEALTGLDEIKELAAQTGPCISIYLPQEGVGTNRQMGAGRLKTALQEVTRRIGAARESDTFLGPLRKFAEREARDEKHPALVIFHAPDYLKVVRCEEIFPETLHIGERFFVLPALASVLEPVRFNLLALSRKHVRLLACSRKSFEPIDLPEGLATSVEAAGGFDRPDHDLENRSSAGPDRGTPGRIHFGTGANREDAYLYNFFRAIDRGLHPLLTPEGMPLIVAAVAEEIAVYHRANTYPQLLKAGIQGSPERIPDRELHRLGVQMMIGHYAEKRRKALRQFEEVGGREAILTTIGASLEAARNGHIAHLLINVNGPGRPEDLNRIALDTIVHGGRISVTAPDEIGGDGAVSALLRYPAANNHKVHVQDEEFAAQ